MTSGAFSLNALYSEENFRLVAGETILGGIKEATQHYFCSNCLSWVFTRPNGLDNMVNIRTPMLEKASNFPPFVDLYLSQGFTGMTSGAHHRFDDAPSIDSFLELADEYAQWSKRPD